MKIDMSWEENKRALFGFLAFLAVHTVVYIFQLDLGIFQMIFAIVAWILVYKLTGKKSDKVG